MFTVDRHKIVGKCLKVTIYAAKFAFPGAILLSSLMNSSEKISTEKSQVCISNLAVIFCENVPVRHWIGSGFEPHSISKNTTSLSLSLRGSPEEPGALPDILIA